MYMNDGTVFMDAVSICVCVCVYVLVNQLSQDPHMQGDSRCGRAQSTISCTCKTVQNSLTESD